MFIYPQKYVFSGEQASCSYIFSSEYIKTATFFQANNPNVVTLFQANNLTIAIPFIDDITVGRLVQRAVCHYLWYCKGYILFHHSNCTKLSGVSSMPLANVPQFQCSHSPRRVYPNTSRPPTQCCRGSEPNM